MQDKAFLVWIHQRLENVHGENPQTDYMGKLRSIIAAMNPKQETPNTMPDLPKEQDQRPPLNFGALNLEVERIFTECGVRIIGHRISTNTFGDKVALYNPHFNDLRYAHDPLFTALEKLEGVEVKYAPGNNTIHIRESR